MKVTKIVSTSLALSACIGLLAACGDRGQFRTKKWTAAEMRANGEAKLARDNAKALANNNNPATADITPMPADTSVAGQNQQNQQGGGAGSKPTQNDPADPQKKAEGGGTQDTGSAGSKLLIEQLKTSTNAFIKANVESIKDLDQNAFEVFKGITASGEISKSPAGMQLAIQASVLIKGKERYVEVAPTLLTFNEKDAKPTKIQAVVKETAEKDAKTLKVSEQDLVILAACKDAKCDEVHVRMVVSFDGGSASLAYVMMLTNDRVNFVVADSNLKNQWTEFADRLEFLKKKDNKGAENVDTTVKDGDKGTKGKDGADGGDDNGGTSEAQKKADLDKAEAEKKAKADAEKAETEKKTKADAEKSEADKKAAEAAKADADKKAADAKAAEAKAAADKKAADAKAAALAADSDSFQKARAAQPAGKPLAFKPDAQQTTAANTNTLNLPKVETPAAVKMQEASTAASQASSQKLITVAQDPGAFKFDSGTATAKAPGIFGTTTGLAGNAVKTEPTKAADAKPVEKTEQKAEVKSDDKAPANGAAAGPATPAPEKKDIRDDINALSEAGFLP